MTSADETGEAFLARLPRRAGRGARPFFAQTCEERPQMGWSEDEVHVFHGEVEIGAYKRSYGRFGAETFEPFERSGRWYALYSSDYTCTRVMSLPDCRDIGGEEPDSGGYCPVELYVPRYRSVTVHYPNRSVIAHWLFESAAETIVQQPGCTYEVGPWQSLDTGFAFGCHWAFPYEVNAFDLTRAAEGILVRDERFGDIEIPDYLPLASIIQLRRLLPGPLEATILRAEHHDVATGRRLSQRE